MVNERQTRFDGEGAANTGAGRSRARRAKCVLALVLALPGAFGFEDKAFLSRE